MKQFDGIRSFEINQVKNSGLVVECSGCLESVDLWPTAAKTLQPKVGDRIAVIPKVEKAKEEWESARDEVLKYFPDATVVNMIRGFKVSSNRFYSCPVVFPITISPKTAWLYAKASCRKDFLNLRFQGPSEG